MHQSHTTKARTIWLRFSLAYPTRERHFMSKLSTKLLGIPGVIFLTSAMISPVALSVETKDASLDWQTPRVSWQIPFAREQPILFARGEERAKLNNFWNNTKELAVDPVTGAQVTRNVVKIRLPLGLSQGPKVPLENPMTVARWELGRQLFFDPVLSSDSTVSCASCHNPKLGFTDQNRVATGINNLEGGMNGPSVMNAAYNFQQFWDGRALSLEDQAQGPVQNPVEMFDGKGHAWHEAVTRIRKKGDYTKRFKEAYGTEPTRDAIAKAIAVYERTVLNGNSIHDRAELAMLTRVAEEESVDRTIKDKDYAKVLSEAFSKPDTRALAALGVNAKTDAGKIGELAEKISAGRALFFGKARCALCHVGENFSDGQYHNLGVGVGKDGKLPADGLGRFAQLPTGHKNPEMMGAFKTPMLRGLISTAPYMHDGSEKTLEQVVDFYDRGGNANEFLSIRMRDPQAEKAYLQSKIDGTPYRGPEVKLFGSDQIPVVPSRLNLTAQEKAALVLFLRALEGEVDAIVTDPTIPVPAN